MERQDIFDAFQFRARRSRQPVGEKLMRSLDGFGIGDLEVFAENLETAFFVGLDVVDAFDLPLNEIL